jgi:general secretion pathway protein G
LFTDLKKMRNEKGFTLIELLVVIVILGILAAVVVFAVGGLTDKGEKSACQTDTKTLRTAQEAFFSQDDLHPGVSTYAANAAALKTADLLANAPKYHEAAGIDTSTPASPASLEKYTITITSNKCGTVGHTVGQDPTDY